MDDRNLPIIGEILNDLINKIANEDKDKQLTNNQIGVPKREIILKDLVYSIKWIKFNKIKIPIVMQNENGPCPLIAICNVLFLRENMTLNENVETIQSSNLINKLADTLFNIFIPRLQQQNQTSSNRLDIEKNIDDTLSKFAQLQYGLDVNVKFNDCRSFEYTDLLDIFDFFGINLYHGWLVDPSDRVLYDKLYDKSYNKLVEFLLSNNDTTDNDHLLKLLVQNFLESTASQLTYYGLSELYANIKINELAILFRNNHFSTVYKNHTDEKLYLLCTDQGYLMHHNIVWELLDNIECDSQFYDSNFNLFDGKQSNSQSQTDYFEENCQNDYLLALSLQQNEEIASETAILSSNRNNGINQELNPTQSTPTSSSANTRISRTQSQQNKKIQKKDTCSIM